MVLTTAAKTLEIRAMEVTDNRTGDATMLPELLSQIPAAEGLVTVTTDGAYDTHAYVTQRFQSVEQQPSFPHVETTNSGKGVHWAIRLALSHYAQ